MRMPCAFFLLAYYLTALIQALLCMNMRFPFFLSTDPVYFKARICMLMPSGFIERAYKLFSITGCLMLMPGRFLQSTLKPLLPAAIRMLVS